MEPGSRWKRDVLPFVAFSLTYVALFVGVPPVPLCAVGACVLNPRPEAFLLAAALPFGTMAIVGVSAGVLSGALLYEAIHPTGITYIDATVAAAAFLVACFSGRWVFRRVGAWPGAVAATLVITGAVTAILGSYALGLRGIGVPEAIIDVFAEAFIPINIAGALFLALFPLRKRRVESPFASREIR
ncbi:MAG: hypothetical protein ACE5JE_05935 [Thermoplasmata archaeon]